MLSVNDAYLEIRCKKYEYIFAYFASAALIKDLNFIQFFKLNGNKKEKIDLNLGTINEAADFELSTLTIYEHLTDKNIIVKIKYFPFFGRKRFHYKILENIERIYPQKYDLLKFLLDNKLFSFWKKSFKKKYNLFKEEIKNQNTLNY